MSASTSVQINLRVPEQVANELDAIAEQEHVTRIDVARQILLKGIAERKRALALHLYRVGKATKSRAAEIAGISLWELIDLIDQESAPNPYTLEDALGEVRQLIAQLDAS